MLGIFIIKVEAEAGIEVTRACLQQSVTNDIIPGIRYELAIPWQS